MGMSWSKLRRIVEDRGAWCAAAYGVTKIVGHDLVTEKQQNKEAQDRALYIL